MSFTVDAEARFNKQSTKDAFHQGAWDEYARQGLPSVKNEQWKYSNLNGITKLNWSEPVAAAAVPANFALVREQWRGEFDILMILNGELRRDESVISTELGELLKPVEAIASNFEDGFSGLSAAVSRPTLRLAVPNRLRVLRPVMILHAQVGAGSWSSSYVEVSIGEGAVLNLVDLYRGEGLYLRTEVARVSVAESGRLNWLRVQNESGQASHFSDVATQLAAGAQVWLTQINAGGQWSRNTLRTDVDGAEAEAHIQGLTFGREQEHIDQRVVVNHKASQTTSSQLFKGVLAGRSRGVLNGKIYIAKDCQKVISSQKNHNMLMNSGAEADTKPELEIYADDVKANHGASVGRIDGDKLFYLESRGIPRAEAERLLVEAFAADVVMKIPVKEMRLLMESWIKELGR